MADLLTLSEYKALQGITTDSRKDPMISALLPAASGAVRKYTGRSFEVTDSVPSQRTFHYEGEEVLDIDDCTSVTAISTDAGTPGQSYDLNSDQWTAMPQDDSEVFYYLLIHGGPFLGLSPEMGFTRNLDTYAWLGIKRPLLTVTATWGWPAIPEDVKLATSMVIAGLVSSPGKDENLTAESIESYARSWGGKQQGATTLAIPNRARDLLVGYQRIFV